MPPKTQGETAEPSLKELFGNNVNGVVLLSAIHDKYWVSISGAGFGMGAFLPFLSPSLNLSLAQIALITENHKNVTLNYGNRPGEARLSRHPISDPHQQTVMPAMAASEMADVRTPTCRGRNPTAWPADWKPDRLVYVTEANMRRAHNKTDRCGRRLWGIHKNAQIAEHPCQSVPLNLLTSKRWAPCNTCKDM